MPLVRVDAVQGRDEAAIEVLLEALHQAILAAFKVPERDRYQIYHAHPSASTVLWDTGLGLNRTDDRIVVTVISRPRTPAQKQQFYREVTTRLLHECRIDKQDVMIVMLDNQDIDWSFGNGEAQFITGAL